MPVDLEIVSPEKLLLARAVDMVVIPALAKAISACMPRAHADDRACCAAAMVDRSTKASRSTDRLFVAGGFAEITAERCTVLADIAEPSSSLNRADGERDLQSAMADLREAERAGDVAAASAATDRVQVAQAIVDIAGQG